MLLKDFIVFTDHYHGRILQIDLETGTLVKLPISVGGVLGLAFDKATKTLFYSEGWTNTIGSTTLHGKNRVLNYNIGKINTKEFIIMEYIQNSVNCEFRFDRFINKY